MGSTQLRLPGKVRGCILDLDGVLVDTEWPRVLAWAETFDACLARRVSEAGDALRPFDVVVDYEEYVEGRAPEDATRTFLASRGIVIPDGHPGDPCEAETVHGLTACQRALVLTRIRSEGVHVYPGSARFVDAARGAGIPCVAVSNADTRQTLEVACAVGLFADKIDGLVTAREQLTGKPTPEAFLAGAALLGLRPAEAAVFEDSLSSVEAARSAEFGYIVGIDRVGNAEAFRALGVDVVVNGLAQLIEPG